MPGYLLHEGAIVLCMHAGQAQPTLLNTRVKVCGQAIVTQQTVYNIAGCALSAFLGGPCLTAQWITSATRVKANGASVLLQDSQAVCIPTGMGLQIVSTQLRVKGI
jgi:hypothetical protein